MLEKDIEAEVVEWAGDLGGFAAKLVDDAGRGFPDRTIFLPGGRIIFPELKLPRQNKKYHMQKVWQERLTRLGFAAGFCESLVDVQRLLLAPEKRGRK